MLNLNYNIIGAGGYDRYSKEEAKGFIPFQIQYLVVGGGGGAAAGDGTTLAGQAGSGGGVVTGSYCVQPFSTYTITVGPAGSGSLNITSTSPQFTGSNGQTSSFEQYVALGGIGGKLQGDLSSSFLQGNGAGTSGSNGNGGSGSLWSYNGPNSPAIGEWSSSLLWGAGGAGYNVPTLFVEYLGLAGGGAGGGVFNANNSQAGGGGAGGVVTGSYAVTGSSNFSITIGDGGITGSGVSSNGGNGSPTTIFGFQATGGSGGTYAGSAAGKTGGDSGAGNKNSFSGGSGYGGGGGGADQNGSGGGPIPGGYAAGNGGNGLSWFNGTYGAGGGGAFTPGAGSVYVGIAGTGNIYGRGGTAAINGGSTNDATNGTKGVAVIRYAGTGSKAIGGEISYSGGYTYHTFTSSANFQVITFPITGSSGQPGPNGGGVAQGMYPFNTGSFNGTQYTGGGAGASFYDRPGANGGNGIVALRYEGAPIADGGQIVITDHYTYHIYTASGQFYAIGQETNPNINPCP